MIAGYAKIRADLGDPKLAPPVPVDMVRVLLSVSKSSKKINPVHVFRITCQTDSGSVHFTTYLSQFSHYFRAPKKNELKSVVKNTLSFD